MKPIAILSSIVALALGAIAAAQNPVNPDDAKLAERFRRFLDAEFEARPLEATRAGDHRFDDRLDDLSEEARTRNRDRLLSTHDHLPSEITVNRLSRDSRIDYEIWRQYLEREVWLIDNMRTYEQDPRVYNDYISEAVYLLFAQSTQPRPIAVRNAKGRIAGIPKILEAAKATLKNPPQVLVETAIRQNKGSIALYESGIFELAEETPALSELKGVAAQTVPLLREYQKWLEEDLLPRANGEWRLGKTKFDRKMEYELNAAIPADQVYAEAEAEFSRVTSEMYVIARQLWAEVFPKTPLPPDDDAGKQRVIRLVLDKLSDQHGKPEDLIKDARAAADDIKKFIRDNDLLKLPDPDRCRIIEMPEFQRGNSIAFLNPAPPLDDKASSIYAISPPPHDWDAARVKSFMREYNRHMLQILTIHEAYPGHYVQLEYANRNPSLIRKMLSSGVFAEGWAVYTESMMLDQGFGKGNLALRLMQLKWYLRTVANAILDHRMHCGNLSDADALRLLVEFAFQSEAEAILKVIRAKQSSCQLSTYFVGRTAFQRLRRLMQAQLGERFELGRFHEAALSHGTLPVGFLPELVTSQLMPPAKK
jgi:uncharacterized protein (DUF885 family)